MSNVLEPNQIGHAEIKSQCPIRICRHQPLSQDACTPYTFFRDLAELHMNKMEAEFEYANKAVTALAKVAEGRKASVDAGLRYTFALRDFHQS